MRASCRFVLSAGGKGREGLMNSWGLNRKPADNFKNKKNLYHEKVNQRIEHFNFSPGRYVRPPFDHCVFVLLCAALVQGE
jgi:hypothetical protein